MPRRQTPEASALADAIRREIAGRELSAYAVAKASGVAPPVIQRFVTGVRVDLKLSTASRICAALGLRLVPSGGATRSLARKPARN